MKQFAKSMLFKSKFLILILILLQGCAIAPRYATGNTKFSTSKKVKSFKTSKKEGKQRIITTGISSFYAEDFHGKLTANGEVYDMYGLTAAHRTMPETSPEHMQSQTSCVKTFEVLSIRF